MSEGSFVDYYELLGVAPDAEPHYIRQAFLRLAKEHHPDIGGSTTTMQQLTKAYRTLLSEKARKAYDLQHEFHSNGPARYYHSAANATNDTSVDDLGDDEIDDFLDTLYAEYRSYPKPKETFFQKLKNLL